jgi:hypothetical protein
VKVCTGGHSLLVIFIEISLMSGFLIPLMVLVHGYAGQ